VAPKPEKERTLAGVFERKKKRGKSPGKKNRKSDSKIKSGEKKLREDLVRGLDVLREEGWSCPQWTDGRRNRGHYGRKGRVEVTYQTVEIDEPSRFNKQPSRELTKKAFPIGGSVKKYFGFAKL